MQRNPHLLVEGCIIGSIAAGANKGFIFIRGEYEPQADILDAAVAEAYEQGLPGRAHPRLRPHASPGRPPRPGRLHLRRGDRPARRARGQARQPAAEAAVPGQPGPLPGADADQQRRDALQRPVHHRARRRVVPPARRGQLHGHEGRLGVRQRAAPEQLRDRARRLGARHRLRARRRAARGREVKCFFPGGSSAPGADQGAPRPALHLRGDGRGGLDARHRRRSSSWTTPQPLVPLALRLAEFYRHESCGKCVPCREGTSWTVKMLERIDEGEGTPMDLDILEQVQGNIIGNCLCVLGDSMAMPVASMLEHFRPEFEQHMEDARARARDLREAVARQWPAPSPTGSASRSTAGRCARRRARCSSTPPSTATSRSPTSATSPSSGTRSARAACAWSRSRASRSCRPRARRRCATAWSSTPPPTASSTPRTRSSSSCSSTTRSTARCATRAASARSRTSPTAGAPGRSRFIEPKRHFKKPLELSPLVAIDRERCILCYRCVRFSQEIAEDYQLVFLERGDHTFVGTHDGAPYVAPFSGNIIELCPVGALTSHRLPLPRAAVGHRGLGDRLHDVPVAVQRRADDARRRQGRARARARQRGRRRRLAVRQGPLRLPVVRLPRADHRAAGARRRLPARGLLGARPDRGEQRPRALRRAHRRAGRRRRHQRGGLPRPAPAARGARLLRRRLP